MRAGLPRRRRAGRESSAAGGGGLTSRASAAADETPRIASGVHSRPRRRPRLGERSASFASRTPPRPPPAACEARRGAARRCSGRAPAAAALRGTAGLPPASPAAARLATSRRAGRRRRPSSLPSYPSSPPPSLCPNPAVHRRPVGVIAIIEVPQARTPRVLLKRSPLPRGWGREGWAARTHAPTRPSTPVDVAPRARGSKGALPRVCLGKFRVRLGKFRVRLGKFRVRLGKRALPRVGFARSLAALGDSRQTLATRWLSTVFKDIIMNEK